MKVSADYSRKMDLQNIGAENKDDAFYRYKMPKMVTKIESRSNGVKTNIVNMVEIAKALERPTSYVIHYLCSELGASSKFDEKSETFRINGAHDTALLDTFIEKFVQCYGCGNPETAVRVSSKSDKVSLKCAACGFVSEVDMMEKLTNFIVKNHPDSKKEKKSKRAEKGQLRASATAAQEQRHKRKGFRT